MYSSFDETRKKLTLMVERVGLQALDRRVKDIQTELRQIITNWRLEIRWRLSRPYKGGKNMTEWPRRRSGHLQDSVPLFTIKVLSKDKVMRNKEIHAKLRIYEAKPKDREEWWTYGDSLNTWNEWNPKNPRAFSGWKDRAYAMLSDALETHIKGGRLI